MAATRNMVSRLPVRDGGDNATMDDMNPPPPMNAQAGIERDGELSELESHPVCKATIKKNTSMMIPSMRMNKKAKMGIPKMTMTKIITRNMESIMNKTLKPYGPTNDKGKGVVGDPPRKPTRNVPRDNMRATDQPQWIEKNAQVPRLGRSINLRGRVTRNDGPCTQEKAKGEKVRPRGGHLRNYINDRIHELVKTEINDGMKLVTLHSGISVRSLLWLEMQRKRSNTLSDFLTRAQGFINLEYANTQAPTTLDNVSNSGFSQQLPTPSIVPLETQYKHLSSTDKLP
uniref:Uncharacterized protein n=1 Tax=Cannabis sativa TaxID=3483 RepID=A0A803P180_CANSA